MSYVGFVLDNRRFLLFGFAFTFFSSFGQTFFIGVFGENIRDDFGLSVGGFGSLYSIATLTSGFCIIWLGRLIDRIDLRLYSAVVCVGLAGAALAMAGVHAVVALGAAIFGLRLFGQGLMSHTAITSMTRYFDEHRGKAMCLAGLGFAAGEAIFPRAAVEMRDLLGGWRETWALIAGVLLVVAAPLGLVLLRGHAARHRELLDRTDTPAADSARDRPERQWRRRDVLRDPRFYLILPAIVAPAFIVTGLFFHQSTLIAERGWTAEWFTTGFYAFAATQFPASLQAGPLVDRLSGRRLLPVLLAPMTLALIALASSDHPLTVMVFMALAGVTSGIIGPIVGAVWPELYGVLHLGAIRAMVGSMMVFATAASPVAMGLLIDVGVTMDSLAWMCVAYCVVATGLMAAGLRSGARPLA